MVIKDSVRKTLESFYEKDGNQLVVCYGKRGCEKEALLMEFLKDKKFFYYRSREASNEEQKRMMSLEVERKYQIHLQKFSYDEIFNRVKSGDPSKLVVVIDEAQLALKKDTELVESLIKLKNKRLYPGPVMIVLAVSSVIWAENDLPELFGEEKKRIDAFLKISDLNFLEVVSVFPNLSSRDCIKIYGVLGGIPSYMRMWDSNADFKTNICNLVLNPDGPLFEEVEQLISSELRELSVYFTILSAIAEGHNKLNDLYQKTGYSRAKISVYMKNLSHFDIVEKVVSFETGGWENAKKGVYQIKDTFVNFWFRFVYPNLSDLYLMTAEEFYEMYIEHELDSYLNRYFRNVCMEYLRLLNQIGRVPFRIEKMGTWIGKLGNIDIIAQSSDRQNIVGLCNWEKRMLTKEMCEELFQAMKKAKISSDHIYLFSARMFEPALIELAKVDRRYELIDMNEL